jgi:hypothetical protein
MLLKNGNAAEKMKTRSAAAMQRSKIRTCSFTATNVFDSPDAIVVALLRRFYYTRGNCTKEKRRSHRTAAF